MKCIIKINENGDCVEDPHSLSNFLDAFPHCDISDETCPEGYVWFTRKHPNLLIPSLKQTIDVRYIKSADGINYEDEYYIRDKTQEEIDFFIQNGLPGPPAKYKSWILDKENDYFWIPPVPKPESNNTETKYRWDEDIQSWIECVGDERESPERIRSHLSTPIKL